MKIEDRLKVLEDSMAELATRLDAIESGSKSVASAHLQASEAALRRMLDMQEAEASAAEQSTSAKKKA